MHDKAGMRLVAALLVAAGAASMVAVPASAQGIDCDAPDLDAVVAELGAARAASLTGDRTGMLDSLEAADAELEAILAACSGTAPTVAPETPQPIASLVPVVLGAQSELGDRTFEHAADLVMLDADLFRDVEEEAATAAAITLGSSPEASDIIESALEEPVPAGFRVLSLAAGDPVATLASIGLYEVDDEIPTDAVAALTDLGARAVESTSNSPTRLELQPVQPLTFPDGGEGGVMAVEFIHQESGEVLAQGGFILRPLPDGDWALGFVVSDPAIAGQSGDELAATLATVSTP